MKTDHDTTLMTCRCPECRRARDLNMELMLIDWGHILSMIGFVVILLVYK